MENHVRVKVLTEQSVEVSPGSFVRYRAGEFYLLPEETARQWIKDGLAVEPDTTEGV